MTVRNLLLNPRLNQHAGSPLELHNALILNTPDTQAGATNQLTKSWSLNLQCKDTTLDPPSAYAMLETDCTGLAGKTVIAAAQDPGIIDKQTGENAWTGAFDGLQSALNDAASTVSMLASDGETVLNDPLTAAHNRTRTLLGLSETSEDKDTLQLSVDDSQSGQVDSYQGVDLSHVDTVMQQDAAVEAYDTAVERFYKALQPTQQQDGK